MRKAALVGALLLGVMASPVRADIPPATLTPIVPQTVTGAPDDAWIGVQGFVLLVQILMGF